MSDRHDRHSQRGRRFVAALFGSSRGRGAASPRLLGQDRPRRRFTASSLSAILVGSTVSVATFAATVATAPSASAAQANCTPDPGYSNCSQFTYSGGNQSFTVPANVTSVNIQAWGAGGGGVDANYTTANSGGGGGGFAQGDLAVTPGQSVNVVVGQGGRTGSSSGGSTSSTYGGGGAGGSHATLLSSSLADGSSGGGYSGVFTTTAPLLLAGGGGGSSPGADNGSPGAGGGGGLTGGQDAVPAESGRGGTQTAGGAGATSSSTCSGAAGAGSGFQGGAGSSPPTLSFFSPNEGGGGGGGGFFGGGGGKCQSGNAASGQQNGAGGGGSSYVGGTGITNGSTTAGGNGTYATLGTAGAAGNNTDAQYVPGVGAGGTATVASGGIGGNGLVVFEWNLGYTITKSASPASVLPGGKVTYTLKIANIGGNAFTATSPAGFSDNLAAVLDDAGYNVDAASSVAGWTFTAGGGILSGSGPLAVGQTATITYSVTVNSPDTGDKSLVNTVTPASAVGSCGANCSTSTPVVAPQTSCPGAIALQNGSFEAPVIGNGTYLIFPQTTAGTVWKTTESDGDIEYWHPNSSGNGTFANNSPVFAEDGAQFAELNANGIGALYQDLATVPGQTMHWSIWHRARDVGVANARDVMQVQIGVPGGTVTPQVPNGQTTANISDPITAWGHYTGTYTIPAGQTTTRFQFAAISTSSGNNSAGNFLDNIQFSNSPCFITTKTVTDLTTSSGTLTRPGDTLQYTVSTLNGGGDASANSVITDLIPSNTTYVPGSLVVDGTSVTDAGGDDKGLYVSSPPQVGATIGTGASGTSGGALAPGSTGTMTFKVTVNANTPAGTSIPNTGNTAYNWPPSTAVINGVSNTVTNQVSTTSMTLAKSVASTNDVNGNGRLDVGDVINYRFLVTDTGSTALSNVAVTDNKVGTVSCPSTTLASGGSVTCTAAYTVTAADANAGSIVNTATAAGTPPGGAAAISSAPSTVTTPVSAAAITLTKTATPTTITAVGATTTYTIVAKNTGNVTLTGVSVTDTMTSPAGPSPTTFTCSTPQPATLAAGQTNTCTATYIATQADVDNGSIKDSATVAGTPPSGSAVNAAANATVAVTATPALTVTKTATPAVVTGSGQSVAYAFLVKNTGNVTLTGVGVTDTQATPSAPSPTVTCPVTTLAPGVTTTCTATYTSTQADVDNGSINDSATASGVSPAGTTITSSASTATVTATPTAALTVTKTPSTTTFSAVGQSTSYTITIKNSGTVTLKNVSATDVFAAPAGTGTALTCSVTQPVALLAPGASFTCTTSYVATQADLNSGAINDTATATGSTPTGTAVTGSGSATVTAVQSPALTVVKTANPTTVTAAGQVVTYSFKITNTGNVTLFTVVPVDTQSAPAGAASTPVCPGATFNPGDSATCTATYTATQADVDNGSINDSAVATGKLASGATVTSPASAATVGVTQGPKLTLTKTAAPTTVTAAGQSVTYTFGVTNTGNVTATNLTIADTFTSPAGPVPTITCAATTLAVGVSTTCTAAAYTVTSADMDAGSIANSAVANAKAPGGGSFASNAATATVAVTQTPKLTLTKTASPTTVTAAGATVSYSFLVANTGNVTVSGITVADTFTAPAGPVPVMTCPATTLAAGTSTTCTATYAVSQADVNAGSIVNSATASGKDPKNAAVTSPASTATVSVTQGAALSVTKTVSPTTVTAAGQVVNYSVAVTNTGNVTVSGIAITDTFTAPAGPVPTFACPSTTLTPGASTTCTASYTTTQADVDAGTIKNSATASGKDPKNATVTSPASTATVTVTQTPKLTLTKTASPANVSAVGQTVTYTFAVANAGNVTATGLSIADTLTAPAAPVPPVTCVATTLAPGASTTCTATYSVTQSDLNAGSLADSAVANATGPGGTSIASPASAATVSVNQSLALTLSKTANPTTITAAGTSIAYTFAVTNSGNLPVTGLNIVDTLTAPAAPTPTVTCTATSLAPGASTTCTATYTATNADVDNGSITNSAVAKAVGPGPGNTTVASSASTATVTATPGPKLTIVKSATPATVTAAGQNVAYSFAVTNTGNVTITGLSVADTFTAPAGPPITVACPATTLPAGTGTTCTASYTATQADIDAGSIKNTATATGKDPKGNTVTAAPSAATVTTTQTSTVALTKTANPSTITAAGQNVTYGFQVTNTGNTTLTGVSIADTFTAPAGPVPSISCPATTLAPGTSTTCTGSYTSTQADVNAGSIVNSAKASVKNPAGTTITSAASTATVGVTQTSTLSLSESANPTSVTAVGQVVTFSYAVTNTGNVTVSNLAAANTFTTPAGPPITASCPATALAPGASTTCTATYVVTQADLDKGSIVNSSTATGTSPTGTTVTSNASSATVTATGAAALTVLKTATPTSVGAAGSTVTFSVQISNSGTVSVTGLTVNDTLTAPAAPTPTFSCPATALLPGTSTTCTATYTVTQADVDAGSIVNTATASGKDPQNKTVTSPASSVTVSAAPAPSLTLTKSASPSTVSTAGTAVAYSFLVKNTGNVTVTSLAVADTFTAPAGPAITVTCPTTTLAPGASTTCTANYTATQADVDAGSISNSATATGKTPAGAATTSNASTATTPITRAGGLTLVKTASPTSITAAGQSVNYSFKATNTGNVTLTALSVADTFTAPAGPVPPITCPVTTLAPGASTTCTASYVATQADVDAGSIVNSATVSAKDPTSKVVTSPAATATVAVAATSKLTVTKSANPSTVSAVGATIAYQIVVANAGTTTITGIAVTDTMTAPAGPSPSVTCPATALAPGTSMTCTASYTVSQADLTNGSIGNSAAASGTAPGGTTVSATGSTATVAVTQAPQLTMTKSVSPTTITTLGQTLTYSFAVKNAGNVPVTGLSIADTFTAPAGPALIISCPATTLAPNATTTCTASYSVTQADLDKGSVVNSATASAQDPNNATVSSPASTATATVTAAPALTVVKTATPTTVTAAGQSVTYKFAVTNTGNVTLNSLAIGDTFTSPAGPALSISCPATTIAPGTGTTCTGTYVVTQPDVNAGSITNSATATAKSPAGTSVTSAASTATVTVTQSSQLTLTETANPTTVTAAGQTVGYTFTVTNPGNTTVTGITINDAFGGGSGPVPTITCQATTLLPGSSTTCLGNYTVTQSDVDAGTILNSSTASGLDPKSAPVTSNSANATVTATAGGKLSVVKSASPTTVSKAGDKITYSFLATNTGNVTLTGLTVTDTMTAPAGPSPLVSCPVTTLAPGASTTCTASYTATQADINAGSIGNSAAVSASDPTGKPITSSSSTATVSIPQGPALTLTKSATPTTVTAAGQTISYSFAVTNSGNVSINNVAVTDTFTAPAGPIGTITCPQSSLAPGATETCTASYKATQADVDQGSIKNTATAGGTTPGGTAVSSSASQFSVAVTQSPNLTVTKSASPTTIGAAGQKINFSFLVNNTGNVTLSLLSITDQLAAPAGPEVSVSCPSRTIAPASTVTCTAVYTVTQADVNAGSVSNSATATAQDPTGKPITSTGSGATVSTSQTPGLSVTSASTPASVTAVGQVVNYSFVVTNTGNLTVSGVGVTDTFAAPAGTGSTVTCANSSLAPGASTTCTQTYTVTQADLDNGSIGTSAVATGTTPAGATVTSTPAAGTEPVNVTATLQVTKTASPLSVKNPGDVVTYTFAVKNTGNVTLGTIAVADTFTAPAGPGSTPSCAVTSLAPGASTTCTSTYATTAADVTQGSIANSATASGTSPKGVAATSNTSSATVSVNQNSALQLTNTPSPTTVTTVGQVVQYTLTVTNTGNLPVSGVAATNSFTSPAGTGTTPVCPTGTVAPGASVTCTASYTVTQADLDNGSINDLPVATATDTNAKQVTSNVAPGVVTVTRSASLVLVKSASPSSVDNAGQTVGYTFTVTNSGNQTITGVTVADTLSAPAGPPVTVTCPASTTLAPNATLTCTASYPVVQADIDHGSINNSATASGKDPRGAAVSSAPSTASVTANQHPNAYGTQTTNVSSVSKAGDVVVFSFNVYNNGNTTFTGGNVTDTLTAPAGPPLAISCPSTTSTPGQTFSCTASYTVTQADIDAGSITSTAIFSAVGADGVRIYSPPTAASVSVVPAPALTILKTASPTTVAAVGQNVSYTFVVTNTGNLTVSGLKVNDTLTAPAGPTPTVACPSTTLAPSASITCTASYSVTQADLDKGTIVNSATANGTLPNGTSTVTSAPSTATVTAAGNAVLSLAKSASPSSISAAGQKVIYSFAVTNTGTVTVHGLTVNDTLASPAGPAITVSCPTTTLAPGASTTCTGTYTATQADVDAGGIANSANVTGADPANAPVKSNTSTASDSATLSSAISVTEAVAPSPITAAGTAVTYTYTVTNTGNTTLSSIAVGSTFTAPAGPEPGVTCPTTPLAPGASTTCTATYTASQADIDKGSIRNTATASASDPAGNAVTSTPVAGTVAVTRAGALTITKSASPTTVVGLGQTISYSFLVKNTGNLSLTNVSVTDTLTAPASPTPTVTCPVTSLAPGVSTTCTASYKATQADLDNGSIGNSARAGGIDTRGTQVVSPASTATVTATQTTTLKLTGTTSPAAITAAGQPVTYSFTVTNTGNVSVSGLGVSENLKAPGGPSPTVTCTDAALAPGASTTCTATYTATQDDIDKGTIAGTALATGTGPTGTAITSNTVANSVPVTTSPAITIITTASPSTVATLGQSVSYSFAVTNTGNVTLTGVGVTDTMTAPAGPSPTVTCPVSSLAPGATTTCTATYTATQADLNNGSITTSAVAAGKTPAAATVTSSPSPATVGVAQTPALTIVKSASPTSVTKPGDKITYSFTVTNSGNVSASAVSVTDTFNSPAGPAITVTCPQTALAPGATISCTATAYTVTQADIDAGGVTNSATATGTLSGGQKVTSPSSAATVTAATAPALTLAGAATPNPITTAGQTVTLTYTVTNSGNTTVTGLATTNTFTAPAGPAVTPTCAVASLAPGASTTCTAPYTVTQADIDNGSIKASGVATGTTNGTPVTSNTATITDPVTSASAATLAETVSAPTYTTVGQVLTYTFTITDSGNTTLSTATVTDAVVGPVTCPTSTVAPGATITCTGTHTVTQADLDAGKITDSAVATLKDPSGATVTTATTTKTVTAVQSGGLTLAESVAPSSVSAAGSTVTYTFTVTNSGNTSVTGVKVNDVFAAPAGPAITPVCAVTSLAVGAFTTCTATYTVTQADLDKGSIADTATATGKTSTGTVGSNTTTGLVTVTRSPALTSSETVNAPTYSAVGQVVSYTETLTNTGNVTLNSPAVADTFTTGSGAAPTFTCSAATIAPTKSITCTGTHTVTQADLDAGSIVDSAVASATAVDGTVVTAPATSTTVTAAATGALSLKETASPTTVAKAGDTVTYTFTVTNGSNQTISGVSVPTTYAAPGGPAGTATCASPTLAPAASTTCTLTYTVTQADIDKGSIVNTSTATGTTPTGTAVSSAPVTGTVTATPASKATLAEVATPTTYSAVGDTITYTFTITDTGNTTLTVPTVTDAVAGTVTCATATVAPGGTISCTATHTVTQADLDAGKITDSAVATLKDPSGATVTTGTTTTTQTAVQSGGLTLAESVSPGTVTAAGATVSYTFTVTNSGNTSVTGVKVNDSFTAPAGPALTPVCAATALAPGASTTCTASYTVTQADLNAGSIKDTATATAASKIATVSSNTTTGSVMATRTATLSATETATPTYSAVGNTITYSTTVTNTGNTTLTGVAVANTTTGTGTAPVFVCAPTTLAPGASSTCTATYKTTQADLDAGSVTDSITASATSPTGPVSATSSATSTAAGSGALTVTEKVTPTTVTTPGQTVTYTYTVTNGTNLSVSGVGVTDSLVNPVCAATTLAPGASTTCTATYTVTQADIDKGSITDTATGNGTLPSGQPTSSAPVTGVVPVTQTSSATLSEVAVPTTYSGVGDVITYTFTVKNTGNTSLSGATVNDPVLGAVTCTATSVAPGASTTCTATHTATQADLDAGKITDSATATLTGPAGPVTTNTTSTTVPAVQSGQLTLTESLSTNTVAAAGNTVTYTFSVLNSSNTTVTNVKVADVLTTPAGPALNPVCASTTLAPGTSTTCTATYTVTQADIDAGSIKDSATASANPQNAPSTTLGSNTTTGTVTAARTATLSATETATPTYSAVGNTITYSTTVTNTGNTTLTGVAVANTTTGTGTAPAYVCTPTTLAPGASSTCTATYKTTQADLNAGSVTDSITASAASPTGPVSATSSATSTAVGASSLTMTEKVSPTTVTAAGQTVLYTFTVTNGGNQSVSAVGVTDSVVSPVCAATTLAPGASTTCTASYTVTQADIDQGSITDTATGSATQPGGQPVSSAPTTGSVTVTQKSSATLTGTATPTTYSAVGDPINYTVTVKNTGNTTLTDPVVTDSQGTTLTCPAGPVAPGASVVCTGTHTVTQADLDAGTVSDTVSGSLTGPTGAPVTATPTTITATAVQTGGLTLTESPAPTTVSAVGSTVTYTFTVTNSSNGTISGVKVTDSLVAPTCAPTTLSPGASATCTATHTVTQADLDAGSIKDTATASGTPAGAPTTKLTSNTTTGTVTATQTATLTATETATSTYSAVGDPITYTVTLTNTGNTTVTGASVTGTTTGTGPAPTFVCTPTTVAPGASATCTATYKATQADIDAGTVTEAVSATATAPTGPVTATSTATSTAVGKGALTVVEKTTPGTVTAAGQTVTYTYTVTNGTNQTVTGVGVTDSLVSPVCATSTLAPGASTTCTATYTVTQADVDKGSISDTATGSGTLPSGQPVTTAPTTGMVPVTQKSSATLAETVSAPTYSAVGDVLTYTFTVTNTGNTTLGAPSISDPTLGTVSCPAGSVAPGASTTCTATHTVTQSDLDAGSITDTATGTLTTPSGSSVTTPTSTQTVTAVQTGGLSLTETVAPTSGATVGSTLTYTFTVTNTGNTQVTGVKIPDVLAAPAGPAFTPVCTTTTLAAGASTTCTATYTVTQADVDHGSVNDSATATATGPSGPPVSSNTTTGSVTLTQSPAVTMTETASASTYSAPGQVITYSFTLTNSGNTTLSSPTVSDPRIGTVTCPTGSGGPGISVVCTATYTVTQADIDAGTIVDSATASATPPSGPAVNSAPTTTTLTAVQTGSLNLSETASPSAVTKVGDVVHYSWTVTNTGTVDVTGVGVTDSLVTPTCASTTLAPGASTTCTASYTVTQDDLDQGSVVDTATATATSPSNVALGSNQTGVTVPATQAPKLAVTVSSSPTAVSAAGDVITYTVTVSNTGNVTVSGITVPATTTGTGPVPVITCPSTSLAPGEHEQCTATYTVTQDDLDNSTISTTVTADGTAPSGTGVNSPTSTATTTVTQAPGLSLTKTATATDVNNDGVTDPGDTIAFTLTVTNTGNQAVTGLSVSDPSAGTVTCPVMTLAPSAATMCTVAGHTVTAADVTAGVVNNTATASGRTASGPLSSKPSSTSTPVRSAPALQLTGSAGPVVDANGDGQTDAGDTVTYTYTVTNNTTGPLTDVTVTDPTLGTITCTPTTLAVGDSATCTSAPYPLTQADIDAGSVTTTATGSGTSSGGSVIASNPSTVTTPLHAAPSLSLVKSGVTADVNHDGVTDVGDTIAYSFVVTNTGGVTVQGLTVNDVKAGAVTCAVTTLAPGASTTCTADALYTVTAADLATGSVTNTAAASGTCATGVTCPPAIISAGSTAVTPVTGQPGLTIVKTGTVSNNADGTADPGDTIVWTIRVTNTGTTPLHAVTILDPTAGAVTCPRTTLAGGASFVCTVPVHVVTAADALAGQVVNVATGTGMGPDGTIYTASGGRATVRVFPTPVVPQGPSGPSTPVAYTGAGPVLPMTVIALTALALGLMLLTVGRRRREF